MSNEKEVCQACGRVKLEPVFIDGYLETMCPKRGCNGGSAPVVELP